MPSQLAKLAADCNTNIPVPRTVFGDHTHETGKPKGRHPITTVASSSRAATVAGTGMLAGGSCCGALTIVLMSPRGSILAAPDKPACRCGQIVRGDFDLMRDSHAFTVPYRRSAFGNSEAGAAIDTKSHSYYADFRPQDTSMVSGVVVQS